MKKLILCLSGLYLVRNYFYRLEYEKYFGLDFRIYYNFTKYGIRDGWLYKDWTSVFFIPFTWMSVETAFIVWYCLSSLCVLVLVWKLMEYRYGWVLVYPCVKIAGWSLGMGNIMPMLACACISPVGCLFAGAFKFYLFGFVLVHALIRLRSNARADEVYVQET